MDIIIRVAYYATVFTASWLVGWYIGKALAKHDRKKRIESFHVVNEIRKSRGLEPLSPFGFDLYPWDVDPSVLTNNEVLS